jgi:hypothetical protein
VTEEKNEEEEEYRIMMNTSDCYSTETNSVSMYIYIYMCVCVCVCVKEFGLYYYLNILDKSFRVTPRNIPRIPFKDTNHVGCHIR